MNSFILKIIALICMTIDHFAVFMLDIEKHPDLFFILRCIGRTAFIIYCFQLSEGIKKTRSKVNYLARLLIFGFISQIPFNLSEGNPILAIDKLNIFFSLAFIFLAMLFIDYAYKVNIFLGYSVFFCLIPLFILCDFFLKPIMYGSYGLIVGTSFYFFDIKKKWTIVIPFIACCCMNYYLVNKIRLYSKSQWWSLAAFIPILLYNGEKGKVRKHFFYAYYPIHLLIFWFLKYFVHLKF